MSKPEPHGEQAPSTSDSQNSPATPKSVHWSMVAIPAAALVLGLLIGGLIVGAGNGGDSVPEATPTVTVSPSVDPSQETAVVVPQECVRAAETLQEATNLLRDNVAAIQEFDTDQILDVLNRLEDLTNEADAQADGCSDIEITPTSETTSTATP